MGLVCCFSSDDGGRSGGGGSKGPKFFFSDGISRERSLGLRSYYERVSGEGKLRFFRNSDDLREDLRSLIDYPSARRVLDYLIDLSLSLVPSDLPKVEGRYEVMRVVKVAQSELSEVTSLTMTGVQFACARLRKYGILLSYQQQRSANCYFLDDYVMAEYRDIDF